MQSNDCDIAFAIFIFFMNNESQMHYNFILFYKLSIASFLLIQVQLLKLKEKSLKLWYKHIIHNLSLLLNIILLVLNSLPVKIKNIKGKHVDNEIRRIKEKKPLKYVVLCLFMQNILVDKCYSTLNIVHFYLFNLVVY